MNMWFVYTHSINGRVFYVGSGVIRPPKKGCHSFGVKYERAYTMCKRSQKWKKFVRSRKVSVDIISHHNTEDSARDAETYLITEMIERFGELTNISCNKPVYQFSFGGVLLNKFRGVNKASRETKINSATIHQCVYGKRRTAGGFLWSLSPEVDKLLDSRPYIIQKTRDGKVVNIYRSVSDAMRAIGTVSQTAIRNSINNIYSHAYGYKWERVFQQNDFEARQAGHLKSKYQK